MLGLSDTALFSYVVKNCSVFSQPPDALDVEELECTVDKYILIDSCQENDDTELIQLCNNKMGSFCIN